ncbi:MAG: hypothetical protein BZ138_07095, partial [Methanosphaera sp. rholeuAM270]
ADESAVLLRAWPDGGLVPEPAFAPGFSASAVEGDGNWGVVCVSPPDAGFDSSRADEHSEDIACAGRTGIGMERGRYSPAVNAACAIASCGYLPRGIDKVLCAGALSQDVQLSLESAGGVVLYRGPAQAGSSLYPADVLEWSWDIGVSSYDGLHPLSGGCRCALKPRAGFSERIDGYYTDVWRWRAAEVTRIVARKIMPWLQTGESIESVLRTWHVACHGMDSALSSLFDVTRRTGFSEPPTPTFPLADNELPISANVAAALLETADDVIREALHISAIWEYALGERGVRFALPGEFGGPADEDELLAKMRRAGADLGVDIMVEAYFEGRLPIEDLCA